VLAASLAAAIAVAAVTSVHAATTASMGFTTNALSDLNKPAALSCPAGTYLAGVEVFQPEISALSPYCGAMAADGSWDGAARMYNREVMSSGNPDSTQESLLCPRDFFVAGFTGYTSVYGIQEITQLTLICRNLRSGERLGLGTPYLSGVAQTQWPEIDCDPSSVAAGVVGTINVDSVVQFGLSCNITRPATVRANLTTKQLAVNLPGPKLPGAPLAVSAMTNLLNSMVRLHWQAPNDNGDLTFTKFRVDARLRGRNGDPWLARAEFPRTNSASYDVTIELPPTAPGRYDWDAVRVCSESSFGTACSLPVTARVNAAEVSAQQGSPLLRLLPASPVDVEFAARAQLVSVSWRLPPGADPTRILQYVIEERVPAVGTAWHPVGAVAGGRAPAYLAHVNRSAQGLSLMRVCAEAVAGRVCSGESQVNGAPFAVRPTQNVTVPEIPNAAAPPPDTRILRARP
jgi:hypothetical protein